MLVIQLILRNWHNALRLATRFGSAASLHDSGYSFGPSRRFKRLAPRLPDDWHMPWVIRKCFNLAADHWNTRIHTLRLAACLVCLDGSQDLCLLSTAANRRFEYHAKRPPRGARCIQPQSHRAANGGGGLGGRVGMPPPVHLGNGRGRLLQGAIEKAMKTHPRPFERACRPSHTPGWSIRTALGRVALPQMIIGWQQTSVGLGRTGGGVWPRGQDETLS